MKVDWIEFYVNEIKVISYKMWLNNESFEPDSANIIIYNSDDDEMLSSACSVATNNMSFTLTTDVTSTAGDYYGVYTIVKDIQTYKKKIKIRVRDI